MAQNQTPFAVSPSTLWLAFLLSHSAVLKVKSGGHSVNSGFSSTPGVQITLSSFSEVVYDANDQTATIGLGLIWDDVYSELDQHGVTVVGAKTTGVGVGGIVLGGGRST